MKALLVHSPNAGTKPTPLTSLMSQLEEAGFAIRYCEHGRDDIRSGMIGMEMAIAAGGDGTVASVAIEMPDRSLPIAILPMGGSNNIARALGIRQSADAVIGGLGDIREKTLTVGRVTGPFGKRGFLEAVGLGALNQSIELVDEAPDTPEEKRENGRAAFREALGTATPVNCAVDIDGRRFDGPWLLVEVLNIGAIGPRLPFAPRCSGPNISRVRHRRVWKPAASSRFSPAACVPGSTIARSRCQTMHGRSRYAWTTSR